MQDTSLHGSEDGHRTQMARFGALLFSGGGAITALGLVLPHQPQIDAAGLAVVAGAAGVLGGLSALGAERFPGWVYAVLPAGGTALVSLALLFNGERHGGPAGGDEMYYLWVVLYAAYFLGRIATAAHAVLIAAAYAAVLVAADPGPIGVSRWLSTVGLVFGTAVVVHMLSRRIGRLVAELQLAARTDGLTGLANRRAFEEHFEREVARAHRTHRPFALLLADIDRFKEINDRYGHVAGDAALSQLGRLLPAELRRDDIPARVGGDEFAVLMPDLDAHEARDLGGRVIRIVSERLSATGPAVGFSFGVAAFGRDGLTLDELTRAADQGLYAAKGAPPGNELAARRRSA